MAVGEDLPKVIWMLWFQGWENAPKMARSSLESWQTSNPAWEVRALDSVSAPKFLDEDTRQLVARDDIPHSARSDIARIALLAQHGGVWADATTICARPLDGWLEDRSNASKFFAFDSPGRGRMVASWFLASALDGYIADAWHEATKRYWATRDEFHHYFWFHFIFAHIYDGDSRVKELWDQRQAIQAKHRFMFGPKSLQLLESPTCEDLQSLGRDDNKDWPVFKLTNKLEVPEHDIPDGALFSVLRRYRPEA